jgi:hypothetical protein
MSSYESGLAEPALDVLAAQRCAWQLGAILGDHL